MCEVNFLEVASGRNRVFTFYRDAGASFKLENIAANKKDWISISKLGHENWKLPESFGNFFLSCKFNSRGLFEQIIYAATSALYWNRCYSWFPYIIPEPICHPQTRQTKKLLPCQSLKSPRELNELTDKKKFSSFLGGKSLENSFLLLFSKAALCACFVRNFLGVKEATFHFFLEGLLRLLLVMVKN